MYLKPTDPDASKDLLTEADVALGDITGIIASRQQGRQQKIKGGSSMRRGGSRRGNPFGDWRP
jgi:hypothetical protein